MRARDCSAPTTSSNRGSERLVVRNERAASNGGQPALSIMRTICRPTQVDSDFGVDGGLLDGEGNYVPCEAVKE